MYIYNNCIYAYESIVASECNYFHILWPKSTHIRSPTLRLPGFPQHRRHFARHQHWLRWCHVADVHGGLEATGGQVRDEAGDVVSILDLGATWRNLARFLLPISSKVDTKIQKHAQNIS